MIEFEELLSVGSYWVLLGAWRALPLIGIVLVADLLLRRRIAARFHCLLWGLVMVRMLVPVSVPSSLSMHGPVDRMMEQMFLVEETPPEPEFDFDLFTFENEEGLSVTIPILPDDASDEMRAKAEEYVASISPIASDPDGNNNVLNVVHERESSVDWWTLIAYGVVGTWILVAFGLLIRGGAAYLRFAARLRRCPQLTEQAIIDQVLRACDAVGARRRPILKEVNDLRVPAVFGLWRPVICLPPGTTSDLSASELRWVLMHEVAHIKRRDPLLLTLAMLMRACQWINPLAWLVVSRLRHYMEQAADDVAMRGTPDQSVVDYGRLLLKYAEANSGGRQPATIGLLFVSTGNSLRQRIEMLDQNRHRNHWLAKVVAIVAVLLVGVTGLTDAKTIEPGRKVPIRLPEVNVSFEPQASAQHPTGPEEAVIYDVRKVLEKLRETVRDPELYLTSFFGPSTLGTASLEDGRLTVKATAQAHLWTKRLLDSWERSGPSQITVECRVIEGDLRLVNDIDWTRDGVVGPSNDQGLAREPVGLDSLEFPNEFPSKGTSQLAIDCREESMQSRPSVAVKISESQVSRLMRRCQQDAHSSIEMAPKITLFNGQHALIQSEVQRPFVTGVRPNALAGGKMDPVIEVVHEGWRMLLHAEAMEEEGVELQCVLTESEIQNVGLANLPFRADDDPTANVTVQVPSVARTSVRSSVRLAKDETLLIASPTAFDPQDTDHVPTATFYLLTPRMSPAKAINEQMIPAQTIPAQTIPAQQIPAQQIPAQTIPAQTIPAQTIPAQTIPAQQIPAQQIVEETTNTPEP